MVAFVAKLRHLTQHCEFGESLQDMLRDRLVCGVNDARLQCRLLTESSLKFETALKLATAWESAERNARDLQGVQSLENVHAISHPPDTHVITGRKGTRAFIIHKALHTMLHLLYTTFTNRIGLVAVIIGHVNALHVDLAGHGYHSNEIRSIGLADS